MPQTVPVPSYVSDNARRGLELVKEGRAGDGLKDKTIREARDMVEGKISEDKVRRMGPWLRRHKADLDAPKNSNPKDPGYPGAGLVAWLLWGGDANGNMRAAEWAERKAESLQNEEARLTPGGYEMEAVDTIEARFATSEAKVLELSATLESANALLTEAKAEVAKAITEKEEAQAKAVAFEAKVSELEAKIAELEKASAPVAAQAAAIVAACSAEPATVTPAVVAEPKKEERPIDKWRSLSGAERTAYFEANKAAIQAAYNSKR